MKSHLSGDVYQQHNMASTSPTSSGTVTSDGTYGSTGWSNASFGTASDDFRATTSSQLNGTPNQAIDSYSESNFGGNINDFNTTYHYHGQSFANTSKISLTSAEFYINRTGSPTGNIVAAIYAHDGGTFGSTGKPTGSTLAVSDNVDVSSISTSKALVSFAFSGLNRIILLASTNYFVILQEVGVTADASNRIVIGYDSTSATHAGSMVRSSDGSSWTVLTSNNATCFYVKGNTLATSYYLKATNYGFSIPTGATINGILVEIEKRTQAGGHIWDDRVRIVTSAGSFGSTEKSTNAKLTDTDTYASYGGASDLWGETWTPADINHINFGVAYAAQGADQGANQYPQVDHFRITVYYTTPGGAFFQMF